AILFHHLNYEELPLVQCKYPDYANFIYLADRIDVVYSKETDRKPDLNKLLELSGTRFDAAFVEAFFEANKDNRLVENLLSGAYRQIIDARFDQMEISNEDALGFLKMLIYSVDFKSDYTVTHTVNTMAISKHLADAFGLSGEQTKKVSLGAALHDLGKLGVPIEILEYKGRLAEAEMEIMRRHVEYTETILKDAVTEEVFNIAVRHHEKLDGSGYPHGLKGEDLSFEERIVAVADIVSALTSERSYKEPFPKDRTIKILTEMSQEGKLDSRICDGVCAHYDKVMEETAASRQEVIDQYNYMAKDYQYILQMIQVNSQKFQQEVE
ncbi:MAG: HD domain-containing protein, partial [Anaerovoracaceae bacterium]